MPYSGTKEEIRNKKQTYYIAHRSHLMKCMKEYHQKNKEIQNEKVRKYNKENYIIIKIKREEYFKNYRLKNKETLAEKRKEHALEAAKYSKIYRAINKEELNKKFYEKYRTNINVRISINMRSRVLLALKTNQKTGHTLELLGCSVEQLKNHLKNKFKSGMSWKNYGKAGWVIDHIRPCASFDLSKPEEQKKCFHYTNLQPLWMEENLRKSDNWENK